MSTWLTVYFTESNLPKTGLTPTVSVYDLSDNSMVVDAESMTEIGNGFYKYNATTSLDSSKDYVGFYDAGTTSVDTRKIPFSANDIDVYIPYIDYNRDFVNSQDEYTVVWYKNGGIVSDVVSPTIQVISRDGNDLVSTSAMSEIGTSNAFGYTETTNLQTVGDSYVVVTSGVVDGVSRSFTIILGRDSN